MRQPWDSKAQTGRVSYYSPWEGDFLPLSLQRSSSLPTSTRNSFEPCNRNVLEGKDSVLTLPLELTEDRLKKTIWGKKNTWPKPLRRERPHFNSLFQRVLPMVAWPCMLGQNSIEAGTCGDLCSSWLIRKQRERQEVARNDTLIHSKDPPHRPTSFN